MATKKNSPMTIDGVVVKTMTDVKRVNKAKSQRDGRAYWFDKGVMRFFNTRLHGGLIGFRYFVTSERYDTSYPLQFSVRQVQPDGGIDTVGDFQDYSTLESAKDAAKRLAKMDQGIPTNPIREGYSPEVKKQNIALLIREGYAEKQAVAVALKAARASYRREHPKGAFPAHLGPKKSTAKKTTKKSTKKSAKKAPAKKRKVSPKLTDAHRRARSTCKKCGRFHTTRDHRRHYYGK